MNFTTLLFYPPERIPVPIEEGLAEPQSGSRPFGEEKNFLPLQGFETQSSSPQAHHTEHAIMCLGYMCLLPTTKHYISVR